MNFIIEKSEEKLLIGVRWRAIFLWVLILLLIAFLLINIFNLQIVNGEESLIQARNISQKQDIVRASRGIIFDTNGKILAKNIPAYSVYIVPGELEPQDDESVITRLAGIINENPEELYSTYLSNAYQESGERTDQPKITLSNDIDYDQYIAILINQKDLVSVYTLETPRRSYPYGGSISHIVGYVSDINSDEVQSTGLDQNANIGKEGIEKSFDTILRGKDGKSIQTRDIFRDETQEYISESPSSGNNIVLTIAIDWQLKLEELSRKYMDEADAFAAVAIITETNTGKIRAMSSIPSYDNNLFAKGISAKDFGWLNADEATPLINRAIGLQLPVGSTFKPMVAAAALETGVLTPYSTFKSGCVELPLYKLCEADGRYLGTMTVVEGLGRSSNVFFCKTGLAMTEKAEGIRTLIKYTDQFGIGKKTGVSLPGEQAGTMATPEFKIEVQNEPWYLADICNTVIGQGLVTATPLQMVTMVGAVGNSGTVYKPGLVERIENQSGEVVEIHESEVKTKVDVSSQNFDLIRKGMSYAVNGQYGSAWLLQGVPGNPYAKTGSADAVEYRKGRRVDGAHSWSIGGFEYEGTDYSFVIHLQEGGRGYKSVPVAADFIRWLYE